MAGNARLSEALKEMAVELTLVRESALGLSAGPLPPRLDGQVKERLLKLVDDAVTAGWAHTRACDVLGIADDPVHRWRARVRVRGTLVDPAPGPHRAVGPDRPVPPQAGAPRLLHRQGVRLSLLGAARGRQERVDLPGVPPRPPRPAPVFPQVPWERNRIWIWDASHFTRARRVAYAIIDVVTRYWIGYLLASEMTSTQVQVLFAHALEDQGLLDVTTGLLLGPDGQPLRRDDDQAPILVAWSDNGPEMTSGDTREFMALMAIAQHRGRPGTPTDQAHLCAHVC